MTRARIEAATEADCHELAATMRAEDRAEVRDGIGMEPLAVLLHSLQGDAYAARDEAGVVLMFGTYPTDTPDTGLVWMLGTERIAAKQKEFLRRCRVVLEVLHRRYPLLVNYADARNEVHLKWLRWCGFKVLRTIPEAGVAGIPFHEIARYKRIECVPQ